ncbi:hypothetical protein AM228_27160 [Planktothricoides sp. SR001]|nr:hypothetical protein AM228_27160 [Planktothricoides sp. SR001]
MLEFFSRRLGMASFLAFGLTAQSMFPAIAQTQFTDTEDHWARACISELKNRRIINGYPDGSFRPNAPVTRAEFASLLMTAFSNRESVREPIQFIDIPTDFWAENAIREAYKRAFLSGYSGRIFNPNQKIPKVQVLVAITAGLNYSANQLTPDQLDLALNDAQGIPEYARSAIAAAIERQLLVNYPNVREFNPNQPATRAEVAAFFCQSLMGVYSPIPIQYIARANGLSSEITGADKPLATGNPQTPVANNPPNAGSNQTETPVGNNPPTSQNQPPTRSPSQAITNGEIRGVWLTNIDSEVLFASENVAAAIARLADLNFNTVYPTVWNWGYTLYPSQVADNVVGSKIDPDPGLRDRDVLAEIIRHSRAKNLRVIPWFEFGFMAPADSELARRRPNWITKRSDGTQVKMEGAHPRVWLNPFHPEVQQFLIDLIVEAVRNYDIDGIQLDDHFGLPSEFGYDEFTIAIYKKENNGKEPPSDPKDPQWLRWRADKITEFMEKLFRAIKAEKEDVIVGVSPNPQNFSYREFLADWSTWEQKGFIEELIVQIYRSDRNAFMVELQDESIQKARKHIPVGIGILSGLKGRPISMADIADQVNIVRNQGYAGVSFFFYESIWNWAPAPANERAESLQNIFPQKIEAPDILQGWEPQKN